MANLRANNLTGTGGRNAIDGSVFFNGNYDGLAIPSIALGSGDWTIEFWFYSTKEGSQDGHIYDGRGTGSASSAYPIIKFDTDEKLSFYTTGAIRIQGSSVVELGSWNHVALVKNSSTTTLYLNGKSEGTYSDSNTYLAPSNSIGRIGSDDNGSAYYFYGYLSNYRICTHAVYTSNFFTPPTQKLELHNETVLLCCQDSDNPLQEATGKTITGYGNLAAFSSGDNLVTNGTFDSATTGWTSDGTATIDSNRLKITNDAANYRSANQDITVVVGKAYRVSADCIAGTSNNSNFHVGTTGSSNALASAVTSPVVVRPTETTLRVTLNVGSNTPGHTALYDNVEVREVEPPKAQKVLPSVGIDEGVVFDGYTKMNSPGVMYFPTGDTSQRGRGRGVFGLANAPSNVNNIEYVQIQSEGNAVDFGDLITAQTAGGAGSSSTRGIFGGGQISGKTNVISYVTIDTTSNATDFGDLSVIRDFVGGLSNSTRGLFLGGRIEPASANSDTVDYVTIASTGNAADFGNLQSIRHGGAGCASPTRGLFGGGNPPNGGMNTIDYFTIASTGNGTDYGDLSVARVQPASLSSSTRGIWSGGTTPSHSDVIDYVTIASTGNAADFGNLTVARRGHGAATNSLRGIFNSGEGSPALVNTIDYVTIATTGNATDFGDCTLARLNNAGCSDSHGGLS